jgi:hypothetical protein
MSFWTIEQLTRATTTQKEAEKARDKAEKAKSQAEAAKREVEQKAKGANKELAVPTIQKPRAAEVSDGTDRL